MVINLFRRLYQMKYLLKSTFYFSKAVQYVQFYLLIVIACSCISKSESSGQVRLIFSPTNPYIMIHDGFSEKIYNIDTGSEGSFLEVPNPEKYKQNSFWAVINAKRKIINYTDIGETTITIGDRKLTSEDKNVVALDSKHEGYERVIGMNFLKNKVFQIDFMKRTIEVSDKIDSQDTKNLESYPIKMDSGIPFISLLIGGQITKFVVDTGFDGFAIINKTSPCENNWRIEESAGDSSQENADIIMIERGYCQTTVQLKSKVLRDEIVIYDPSYADNLLGFEFFSRFERVIFDFQQGILHLGPMRKGVTLSYFRTYQEYVNSVGFTFTSEGYPVVNGVSTTLNHPIQYGDTLVNVDGLPVYGPIQNHRSVDTSFSAINFALRRLRFSWFDTMKLSTIRDGKIVDHVLRRKYGKRKKSNVHVYNLYVPDNNLLMPISNNEQEKYEKSKLMNK